ncbi:hypothetical protein B0J13DRAFT_506762 [Dactylonectria estremocensis]|uniref:Uncharacterized protein n=1 Tax=Dactylonectria estremocensis TaxID=1079267 RepID=A0A9P9EH06_9HYPO|nr:hypothetical protein B0J13DRAFT_506762 [Dactylonectria estremocensis]
MSTPLVYFEVSWSILSVICMCNVLFGCVVCGITSFTLLALVPIISSAGGAIACGLCYYIYYLPYPAVNRAVASVFGDLFWLVQEAGLLFYSYMILARVLRGIRWRVFAGLFWVLTLGVIVTRVAIAVYRVRSILDDNHQLQVIINYLHISYFSLMAILECISAYFLITIFTNARDTSFQAAMKIGLFRYLTRSTEVRVGILAVQGILRAITHSFQTPGQRADNIASQLDRFLYTVFCLYPVLLFIDLLASKLRFTTTPNGSSSYGNGATSSRSKGVSTGRRENYSMGRSEHVVEVHGGKTMLDKNGSQEQIIPGNSSQATSEIDLEDMDTRGNVIKKTVEFKVV